MVRPLDPRLAPPNAPTGDSRSTSRSSDPGVPEALPQAVAELLERIPPGRVDRLWLFPPLRKGRREHGLVAVSRFPGDGEEEGPWAPGDSPEGEAPPAPSGTEAPLRRVLATLAYRAEETGKGVTVQTRFQEEGEAPPDRLPRIMSGVVRRTSAATGDPVAVAVEGEAARLAEALAELGIPWSPPPSAEGRPVDEEPQEPQQGRDP